MLQFIPLNPATTDWLIARTLGRVKSWLDLAASEVLAILNSWIKGFLEDPQILGYFSDMGFGQGFTGGIHDLNFHLLNRNATTDDGGRTRGIFRSWDGFAIFL